MPSLFVVAEGKDQQKLDIVFEAPHVALLRMFVSRDSEIGTYFWY